jgi:hypothetical protein
MMSLWRVRISLGDDPHSQELLDAALADQRVWVTPDADKAGDVIIDLPRDDALDTLLNRLHSLSPSVFVSSVDQPLPVTSS